MMRGYKINKDDSTTLKIGKMNIVGNMMPEKWFKELTTESGRPYFPAILTLAEAVYWYKPIIVKNPQTYEFVGYRKKFKSDMWQINYESIAKKYGMTKRQIQDATSYLVNDINIFYRELRKVSIKGRKLPNVPFVDINTKKLAEITYYRNSDEDVTCVTSQRDTSHVSKGYITETTTETRLKKEEVKEEKNSTASDIHLPKKLRNGGKRYLDIVRTRNLIEKYGFEKVQSMFNEFSKNIASSDRFDPKKGPGLFVKKLNDGYFDLEVPDYESKDKENKKVEYRNRISKCVSEIRSTDKSKLPIEDPIILEISKLIKSRSSDLNFEDKLILYRLREKIANLESNRRDILSDICKGYGIEID